MRIESREEVGVVGGGKEALAEELDEEETREEVSGGWGWRARLVGRR